MNLENITKIRRELDHKGSRNLVSLEEKTIPFHQRKDLQECVYVEHSGIHTTFLEGFPIRISQNFKNELFRNQLEI